METGFLDDFKREAARRGLMLHGVAVQQRGALVDAHQWQDDVPHILHSLSKSFTAMAVGMLVEDGRLSLDDSVTGFFPDDCPDNVSPELAAMTVRHLLTMSAGHAQPKMMSYQRKEIRDDNWVRYYLSCPPDRMPGERFVYDSGCTYMLSAIAQAITGQTVLDYLTPRLFEPLGIGRPAWETCPRGITLGCAGLFLRTRQLLPFGQMLLDGGSYGGRQLVPRRWVEQ
ncbi:MAG: serine hydrolase, partial [Eubacteriales bacterium]|nr:serine hydrolase [Eubacteriales bacterium]